MTAKSQLHAVPAPDSKPQPSAPFVTDAEKHSLPVTNTTTGSGAPRLKVDEVLKWEPKHLGRK